MDETVKFDPGIGEFVVDFNNYINDVYSHIMNLYSPHQKRAQFKLYASKIKKYMQNNIAFYKGCLLWAYYIKNCNTKTPKLITGNSFLNLTEEEKNNYDFMIQINFLENYFDSFERDTAYYLGKKEIIPKDWKKILSLYGEFLEKNNGFVNTKTTADIVLPEGILFADTDLNLINEKIQKAIKEKNLDLLLTDEKLVI